MQKNCVLGQLWLPAVEYLIFAWTNLFYMYYPNIRIPVCNGLTRRVAAGGYRGVCSTANPKQVGLCSGADGPEILHCTGQLKEQIQPQSWYQLWVSAGASAMLKDGVPLPPCCAGDTEHLSVSHPCASSVEHQKLLWNNSLKHFFLVEGFWEFIYKPELICELWKIVHIFVKNKCELAVSGCAWELLYCRMIPLWERACSSGVIFTSKCTGWGDFA